jgi:hypothetical protein
MRELTFVCCVVRYAAPGWSAAAYGPLAQRVAERPLPDYLVVSYDRLRSIVVLAEFLDGASLGSERIVARVPLAAGARRAGWVGATIDLTGLERRVVVGPSFDPEVTTWRCRLTTTR